MSLTIFNKNSIVANCFFFSDSTKKPRLHLHRQKPHNEGVVASGGSNLKMVVKLSEKIIVFNIHLGEVFPFFSILPVFFFWVGMYSYSSHNMIERKIFDAAGCDMSHDEVPS